MGRSIILRAMRWENGVRRLRAQRLCPQFLQKLIPFFPSVRLLMGCTMVNQAWISVTVHPAFCWEGNNLCRLCDISEKYFHSLHSTLMIFIQVLSSGSPKTLNSVIVYSLSCRSNLYYFHFVWHTQGAFYLFI